MDRGREENLSRAPFQFMLIRWPVQYASYMQMSRLHVPPIFRLWQLPALPPPLQLPSPLFPGNINRRAYYTMRCVPGSMEELPLSSCLPCPSFSHHALGTPSCFVPFLSHCLSLCISHTKHAATFLASSRCVCICPTVRYIGKGGTKLFMLHLSCCCTAGGRAE